MYYLIIMTVIKKNTPTAKAEQKLLNQIVDNIVACYKSDSPAPISVTKLHIDYRKRLKYYRREVIEEDGRKIYDAAIQKTMDKLRGKNKDAWSEIWDELAKCEDQEFKGILSSLK